MIPERFFTLNGKIRRSEEEVYRRNSQNFVAMTAGGACITGVIFVLGCLMSDYTGFTREYALFFAYFLAIYLVARFCQKRKVACIQKVYYIAITPIMLGGIWLGTFCDSQKPAFLIMLLMCIIMLFLIDYPVRIFLYLLAVAIVFAVCCYKAKSLDLFYSDIVNLVIYFSITIGVNYFMLRERIISAENYCWLQHKSEMDSLTGLLNRGAGEKKVRRLIQQHTTGAFVILDIDNFKFFNDTYGHQFGDEVIMQLSYSLNRTFRDQDVVFRLGGDEFAVFATNLTDEKQCQQRFKELEKMLKKIEIEKKKSVSIGISIGCTIIQSDVIDFEEIYRSSDDALYEAKTTGKGKTVIAYLPKK